MTPQEIQAWAQASVACIAVLKEAISLLPDGSKKKQAERLLAEAEEQRRIAAQDLAVKQGFQLCQRHFPAGIMVIGDTGVWTCLECGKPISSATDTTGRIVLTHASTQARVR